MSKLILFTALVASVCLSGTGPTTRPVSDAAEPEAELRDISKKDAGDSNDPCINEFHAVAAVKERLGRILAGPHRMRFEQFPMQDVCMGVVVTQRSVEWNVQFSWNGDVRMITAFELGKGRIGRVLIPPYTERDLVEFARLTGFTIRGED